MNNESLSRSSWLHRDLNAVPITGTSLLVGLQLSSSYGVWPPGVLNHILRISNGEVRRPFLGSKFSIIFVWSFFGGSNFLVDFFRKERFWPGLNCTCILMGLQLKEWTFLFWVGGYILGHCTLFCFCWAVLNRVQDLFDSNNLIIWASPSLIWLSSPPPHPSFPGIWPVWASH